MMNLAIYHSMLLPYNVVLQISNNQIIRSHLSFVPDHSSANIYVTVWAKTRLVRTC